MEFLYSILTLVFGIIIGAGGMLLYLKRKMLSELDSFEEHIEAMDTMMDDIEDHQS